MLYLQQLLVFLKNLININNTFCSNIEIKAGTFDTTQSKSTKVKFEKPFSNKCVIALCIDTVNAGDNPYVTGIDMTTITKEGFTATHGQYLSKVCYLAIGY